MSAPMKFWPPSVASMFKFVREANTQNTGQRVEAIQRWCGGKVGDSYCAYFATMILDICFQGDAPIPREGSCEVIYELAKKNGWVTSKPTVGDLFLYVNAADHAHHVGIVSSISPLKGIAGNTSADGTSSNGNGVFEHAINASVFVHYPRTMVQP